MKIVTKAVLSIAVVAAAAAPARAALSINLDSIAAQAASLGGVSSQQAADLAAQARDGRQEGRVVLASDEKEPHTVVGGNGVTGMRNGNTTIYSNGVTEFHNGNTSMRSDGVTGFTVGGTTTYSDGHVCNDFGDTRVCN